MKTKPWTPKRLQTLHEMRADEKTGDEIAKAIGLHRTTVFRKLGELGLIVRKVKATGKRSFNRKGAPEDRIPPYRPKIFADAPKPIGSINEFPAKGCRWIYGEPTRGNWHCCGHGAETWCDFHKPKIYIPRPSNKDDGAIA